jgi:hypothetical protein
MDCLLLTRLHLDLFYRLHLDLFYLHSQNEIHEFNMFTIKEYLKHSLIPKLCTKEN